MKPLSASGLRGPDGHLRAAMLPAAACADLKTDSDWPKSRIHRACGPDAAPHPVQPANRQPMSDSADAPEALESAAQEADSDAVEPLATSLDDIEAITASLPAAGQRLDVHALVEAWRKLALRCAGFQREPKAEGFDAWIERLDADLLTLFENETDRSLLLLVFSAGSSAEGYSANHSLLVCMSCELSARQLGWDDDRRKSLRRAALTMNIAMFQLQDQLALQTDPLSDEQRAMIDEHEAQGVSKLRELGVSDDIWLQAVENHHQVAAGDLFSMEPGLQVARLIQRADLMTARLSVRRSRDSLSGTLAAKSAYFDENERPDAAGSALIKALGIYPPGTYVTLASGETAVVLSRGASANKPTVAAITNSNGMPHHTPTLRYTDHKLYAVTSSLARKDFNVRTAIESLLRLAD